MHEPTLHDVSLAASPGSTLVSADQQKIDAAQLAIIGGRGEGLPPKKFGEAMARLWGSIRAAVFQRQAQRDEVGIEHAAFHCFERQEASYWHQLSHRRAIPPIDFAAIRKASGNMHHVHPPLHEEKDEERLYDQDWLDKAA